MQQPSIALFVLDVVVDDGSAEALTSKTRYDDLNRTVTAVDPYGVASSQARDALGRVVARTDTAGNVSAMAYDARGNLTAVTPPTGAPDAPVSYLYDAANRRVSESQNGDLRTFEYDAAGRMIGQTDFNGVPALTFYDAAGRRAMTVQAAGTPAQAVTKFDYDPNGNLVKVINANYADPTTLDVYETTAIIRYEYDEANRRIRETDASDETVEVTYDPNGNGAATLRRDGQLVSRVYDNLNRLTRLSVDPDGSGPLLPYQAAGQPDPADQLFGYDALSRMTFATDFNGGAATRTVAYAYNDPTDGARDQREHQYADAFDTADPFPTGSPFVERTVAANADPLYCKSLTVSYPLGSRSFSKRYDAAGRLESNRDNLDNAIAAYGYDQMNRPDSLTLPTPAVTASVSYDARGREDVRDYVGLFTQDSNYDANGNVVQEDNAGAASPVDGLRDYTHDEQNRIETAVQPASSNIDDAIWTYDAVGNWTQIDREGAVEDRTVNADNEYTNVSKVGVPPAVVPQYDPNGNLTHLGDREFVYDWANRLIEVKDNGVTTATYTYDALNRRVSKTIVGGAPSSGDLTVEFLYDGSQVVQEREDGGSGFTLARTYVYGQYVDAPTVMIDEVAAQTYYYLRDRRANVVALIDATGSVVESYDYSPFGEQTVFDGLGAPLSLSAIGNPYGFTGRRFDLETGLWYYRNRIYSAGLGRFLQRDPAGFVDGYNLYAYVSNNPLMLVDPTGLNSQRGPTPTNLSDGLFFQYDDGGAIYQSVEVRSGQQGIVRYLQPGLDPVIVDMSGNIGSVDVSNLNPNGAYTQVLRGKSGIRTANGINSNFRSFHSEFARAVDVSLRGGGIALNSPNITVPQPMTVRQLSTYQFDVDSHLKGFGAVLDVLNIASSGAALLEYAEQGNAAYSQFGFWETGIGMIASVVSVGGYAADLTAAGGSAASTGASTLTSVAYGAGIVGGVYNLVKIGHTGYVGHQTYSAMNAAELNQLRTNQLIRNANAIGYSLSYLDDDQANEFLSQTINQGRMQAADYIDYMSGKLSQFNDDGTSWTNPYVRVESRGLFPVTIDMSKLHEQDVTSSLGYQLYTGTIGGAERMDDLFNIAAWNRAKEYATAKNYSTERYVNLRDNGIQSLDNEYERSLNANGVFRSPLTRNGAFSEFLSGDGGQSAPFTIRGRPSWNHSSGFYPKPTNLTNRIFR